MHTRTHPSQAACRQAPGDVNEHAAFLIEERFDQWRKLQRALVVALEHSSDPQGVPPCQARKQPQEVSVSVLHTKCDRALGALGAAVAAARSLAAQDRTYPLMDA